MMWKDDKEFIAGFEPGILNVLDWFERRRQPNGLLGKIEWWGAFAWPRYYINGEPPDIYTGNNTLYTLQYAYTLRHAADIFSFLGKPERADDLRNRAEEICSSVNRLCKNQDGFYSESITNHQISQITNILAVLSEAVNGDEARVLMNRLLEPKDWFGQVDLFLHLYLFEALNKTGLQDHFSDELSEWLLMKKRGMTTFAEVPLEWGEENQRSECHPWSSSPNYFFFRTVCGIKPLTPGHREIEIAPSFGSLTWIDAIYPYHLGNIEISLKRNGSKIEGQITIPAGMKAYFIWGTKRTELKEGKQLISL
jgi:alpha-L-rhamnosidase